MIFILSAHDPLVLRRFRSNLISTRQNTVKTLEEVDIFLFFFYPLSAKDIPYYLNMKTKRNRIKVKYLLTLQKSLLAVNTILV